MRKRTPWFPEKLDNSSQPRNVSIRNMLSSRDLQALVNIKFPLTHRYAAAAIGANNVATEVHSEYT